MRSTVVIKDEARRDDEKCTVVMKGEARKDDEKYCGDER